MSASGRRATQGQPDTCLFLAFDEVTNAGPISDSRENRAGKQEGKEKKHGRVELEWPQNDCAGFPNEASAKVTHFLSLFSLYLPLPLPPANLLMQLPQIFHAEVKA